MKWIYYIIHVYKKIDLSKKCYYKYVINLIIQKYIIYINMLLHVYKYCII